MKTAEKTTLQDAANLAPIVEVRGEITNTNFPQIKEMILAGLELVNTEPETDEEFGQAEQDTKNLKLVENALTKAKAEAIKQAEDIERLFADIDDTSEQCRQARLALEKKVKAKKEEIRKDILADELAKVEAVSQEHYRARMEGAMKGKRTLKSWRDAAKKERIAINSEVAKAHELIDRYTAQHGDKIALDRNRLELMGVEALETELQGRVARLAAEVARKKAEAEAAAAKAEAEAVKKQAEEAAKPPLPAPPLEDPPKVDKIPVGRSDDQRKADAEWQVFKGQVFAALAPLKAARDELECQGNISKATHFANAVNAAWKEVSA